MITAIPKRNFLVRNDYVDGKRKDVIAKKGEKINLSDEEAVRFWGSVDISEKDKQNLLKVAKNQKFKRLV